jgi:phosphoribosylamine-glycine ligase
MKTFLFLNYNGCFESIAQRVKAEGNAILYWKAAKLFKGGDATGTGIFDKKELVDDFWETLRTVPKKDLIILVDDNGEGEMFDHLRSEGYAIIGGSALGDKIEHERMLGTKLMQKIGLKVPDTHSFNKIKDGIDFANKQDPEKRFVFKPDGLELAGSAKTYTAKNIEDLVEYMKWIESDCVEKHYSIEKFELQEFIKGIEADFAAYFDGEKFMKGSFVIDIEEKKTGDGNKGQATGCMGNIISFFDETKYFYDYLDKLTPFLKECNYVGEISINNIFEEETGEPYGLEFTSRFGWDAHLTELAIIKDSGGSISDLYIAWANKQPFKFDHKLTGCGVRVHCNQPGVDKAEARGRRFSFDPSIEDKLWFYSAYKNDNSYMMDDGIVLVANTTDTLVRRAIEKCYDEVLPKINISDIAYRMEIGQRAPEVLRFLAFHRWLT